MTVEADINKNHGSSQGNMLREHLIKLLEWQDAHVNFDDAVQGIPVPLQGVRPEGLPYSPWELFEHIRLTQNDILNFCRNSAYKAPKWPEEYWPKATAPSTPAEAIATVKSSGRKSRCNKLIDSSIHPYSRGEYRQR